MEEGDADDDDEEKEDKKAKAGGKRPSMPTSKTGPLGENFESRILKVG